MSTPDAQQPADAVAIVADDQPVVVPDEAALDPLGTHAGVRAMTEDEAAALFALPELLDAANQVQGLLSNHRSHAGQGDDSRQAANRHWLEAGAMTQMEGGRVHKVKGNLHNANALLYQHRAELAAAQAELVWAELAVKHQCFLPSPFRLEVMMAERPADGYVYCWDATEREMAWHKIDDCGAGPLRHVHPENWLRVWDQKSQNLVAVPGRKGLP